MVAVFGSLLSSALVLSVLNSPVNFPSYPLPEWQAEVDSALHDLNDGPTRCPEVVSRVNEVYEKIAGWECNEENIRKAVAGEIKPAETLGPAELQIILDATNRVISDCVMPNFRRVQIRSNLAEQTEEGILLMQQASVYLMAPALIVDQALKGLNEEDLKRIPSEVRDSLITFTSTTVNTNAVLYELWGKTRPSADRKMHRKELRAYLSQVRKMFPAFGREDLAKELDSRMGGSKFMGAKEPGWFEYFEQAEGVESCSLAWDLVNDGFDLLGRTVPEAKRVKKLWEKLHALTSRCFLNSAKQYSLSGAGEGGDEAWNLLKEARAFLEFPTSWFQVLPRTAGNPDLLESTEDYRDAVLEYCKLTEAVLDVHVDFTKLVLRQGDGTDSLFARISSGLEALAEDYNRYGDVSAAERVRRKVNSFQQSIH